MEKVCTELTKQKNPSVLTCQTASLFLTKRKTHRAHVTPALSITSLIAMCKNTCQIKCTEPPRKGQHTHFCPRTHPHKLHAYVSLQPLISLAAGPSFRITLLSSQPQGAKLFKYSNSSLLPPTRPLSLSSTLPLIICLFIVANLEAIPPINDANCSKWCRSSVSEGVGGGGWGRQRKGSGARVAKTMLRILQAAVQI